MSTESDRELLELAAKAAGVELDYTIRPDGKFFYHSDRNALATSDGGWFAPLTDDGDALRLAVKLDLLIDPKKSDGLTDVIAPMSLSREGGKSTSGLAEWHRESDPYAATRRAIVRAAAEIGKAMSCT